MDFYKLPSRLERLRILLFNSLSNEEIKNKVASFGYDETKLLHGISLYNETLELFSIRENSLETQVNATLSFNNELIKAKELFQNIVTITRRVFKPFLEGMALLPATTYISDFDVWKDVVSNMYNGILEMPHLLQKLAKYEFTEELFRQEIKKIELIEKSINEQKIKNAELQLKTALRNQKLKEFQEFCTIYQEIVTTALIEQPHLLEILGIKVLKKYLAASNPAKTKKLNKDKK